MSSQNLQNYSYPELLTPVAKLGKSLAAVVALIFAAVIVAPILTAPVLVAGVFAEKNFLGRSGDLSDLLADGMNAAHPSFMLFLNLSLAALIPISILLYRWFYRISGKWLGSLKPGLRWGLFPIYFLFSLVAVASAYLLALLLPEGSLPAASPDFDLTKIVLAVVILLTTPLQAAGEEYAFRGFLMQNFGAIFRPIPTILITAVLFGLAHGYQNAPLFFDRFAFGVVAGIAVWKTGGLEAGIALHVVNNLTAFGMELAFGDLQSALEVTEASWWIIPVTLLQSLLFLGLVLWHQRRKRLMNLVSGPAAL